MLRFIVGESNRPMIDTRTRPVFHLPEQSRETLFMPRPVTLFTGQWADLSFDAICAKAKSFGYDGVGDSAHNALRIYNSSANSLFTFQANGSMGIGTNSPQQALHVIGNILASGTVTGSSDRNVKENFAAINSSEVLDKVAALPISRWNYKNETDVTHLGPMAQDFYAAFGLGGSDTTITTVDPDGVALAAIQGLNEKLEKQIEQQAAQMKEKEARINSLEDRLATLEKLLQSRPRKGNE